MRHAVSQIGVASRYLYQKNRKRHEITTVKELKTKEEHKYILYSAKMKRCMNMYRSNKSYCIMCRQITIN